MIDYFVNALEPKGSILSLNFFGGGQLLEGK